MASMKNEVLKGRLIGLKQAIENYVGTFGWAIAVEDKQKDAAEWLYEELNNTKIDLKWAERRRNEGE